MAKIVQAHELYGTPTPSDELVWAVCDNIAHPKRACCKRCPKSFTDHDFGEMVHGCRAQAEDAARAAMAVLEREGWKAP